MELREGYKQTDIGVIPKDWLIKKLGDVARVEMGQSPSSEFYNYKGVGLPLIQGNADIKNRKTIIRSYTSKVTKRCDLGDTLMTVRAPVGEIATATFDACIGRGMCAIQYHNKYLHHYLKFIESSWGRLSKGSTFDSVTSSEVKELKVCIPSSQSEQIIIANALSGADDWIQSLTSLIAKKQNIKQGTIQTLLNPYENGKLKDGWGVKKLGDFLNYEQPTNYLVSSTEYNDNNSIPVLTAGKTFVLGYTNEEFGVYEFDLPVIIFDDFTTASKFVDFPFKAKSSAMKILKRKNEKVNLRFIFEVLQMIDYPLGDHKRHWIGEFQYLDIFVPNDENEQTRIADILADMDEEISILKGKLIKSKQVKQGMMQNLLTGKIRLV